jgi:hypothetical protein
MSAIRACAGVMITFTVAQIACDYFFACGPRPIAIAPGVPAVASRARLRLRAGVRRTPPQTRGRAAPRKPASQVMATASISAGDVGLAGREKILRGFTRAW